MQEAWNGSPGEEMATLNILAWEILWIDGLVGYNPWCYKKFDMTEHTQAYLNEVVKK